MNYDPLLSSYEKRILETIKMDKVYGHGICEICKAVFQITDKHKDVVRCSSCTLEK